MILDTILHAALVDNMSIKDDPSAKNGAGHVFTASGSLRGISMASSRWHADTFYNIQQ